MSRPTAIVVVTLAGVVALGITGCRTATGPGIHVGVRAEPKKGYKPPLIGPGGEVFGYGATVEPGPMEQAAPPEPGFDLIDYRRLGGIIVWVERAGGSAPAPSAMPPTASGEPAPLNARVNLDSKGRDNFEHVHLASVGGRILFGGTAARQGGFILRTEGGDVLDLPPVFVPSDPGLVEVLPAYGEGEEAVALIYVAPTPRARKVRHGERVTFAPLPPGSYRVSTWHPVLPGSSEVVEVTPGPLVKLTLTVGVNALPKAGRR